MYLENNYNYKNCYYNFIENVKYDFIKMKPELEEQAREQLTYYREPDPDKLKDKTIELYCDYIWNNINDYFYIYELQYVNDYEFIEAIYKELLKNNIIDYSNHKYLYLKIKQGISDIQNDEDLTEDELYDEDTPNPAQRTIDQDKLYIKIYDIINLLYY